jgi:hypothetical protein
MDRSHLGPPGVPADSEHHEAGEDAAGHRGGPAPAVARSGLGRLHPAPAGLAVGDRDQRPGRPSGLVGLLAGEVAQLGDDRADAVPLPAGGLTVVDHGQLDRTRLLVAAVDVPQHVAEAVAAEVRPAIPGVRELLRWGELGSEVEELLEVLSAELGVGGLMRVDHRSALPENAAVRAARHGDGVRGMVSHPFHGERALPM